MPRAQRSRSLYLYRQLTDRNNDDLRSPHRLCVAAGMGKVLDAVGPLPAWLTPYLSQQEATDSDDSICGP